MLSPNRNGSRRSIVSLRIVLAKSAMESVRARDMVAEKIADIVCFNYEDV